MLAKAPGEDVYTVLVQNDSLVGYLLPGEMPTARAGFARGGLRGYWESRLELLTRRSTGSYVRPFLFAECYAQLGELDKALDALEESVKTGDGLIDYLRIWVPFDPVRSHPRYADLLKKLNLPE